MPITSNVIPKDEVTVSGMSNGHAQSKTNDPTYAGIGYIKMHGIVHREQDTIANRSRNHEPEILRQLYVADQDCFGSRPVPI